MRHQSARTTTDSAPHRVESLTAEHIEGAVRVFDEAFPNHVLGALGPPVVRELLASYVADPGGCGYVCVQDEDVVGFVVGTEDAASHRQLLLGSRFMPLFFHVLTRLFASPHLAMRLLRYFRTLLAPGYLLRVRSGTSADTTGMPPASLVLLAVRPDHRRRGIADQLMQRFLDTLRKRGVEQVKLAVSTSNKVAVRFYLSRNWEIAGCYPSPEGGSAYRLVYRTA